MLEASESCLVVVCFSSLESFFSGSVVRALELFSKVLGFESQEWLCFFCQDSVWSPGFPFSCVFRSFFSFFR